MAAHAGARVAAHPSGGDHEKGELRRQVINLSGRLVGWDSLDGGWWMFDGHNSHCSALARTREQVPFRERVIDMSSAVTAGTMRALDFGECFAHSSMEDRPVCPLSVHL